MYLNHFAVYMKLTKHCKSTILKSIANCNFLNPSKIIDDTTELLLKRPYILRF